MSEKKDSKGITMNKWWDSKLNKMMNDLSVDLTRCVSSSASKTVECEQCGSSCVRADAHVVCHDCWTWCNKRYVIKGQGQGSVAKDDEEEEEENGPPLFNGILLNNRTKEFKGVIRKYNPIDRSGFLTIPGFEFVDQYALSQDIEVVKLWQIPAKMVASSVNSIPLD
jgi:hypothetical protein